MTSERSHQLLLVDEANKKSYTLTVSLEDYEKASIDSDYGGILLVEHLNAGHAVTMENIEIEDNCIGELCNDENMPPANHQNDEPFRVENVEIEDEPLDVSCHKNRPANHQNDHESTAYNWKEDETFLLIDCYRKEDIHLLVRKPDVSAALQRCVSTFNSMLLKKKGQTVPFSKCSSKIDSLKRLYREKLDLKNKSGGASITWTYFEVLHELFHKEKWVKPLSVAGSSVPVNLDVQVAEPRSKQAKPLQTLFEEIKVDRHVKQQSDALKHKEKMTRLDRFNDCMESMAESFSIIAAAKKAKLERDTC